MFQISERYGQDLSFIGRADDVEDVEFDFHCPEVPGGLNTTKKRCRMKQWRGGGCYRAKCPEGREMSGYPRPAPPARLPKIGPCACGQPSMNRDRLDRASLTAPTCPECYKGILGERRRERNRVAYVAKAAERKRAKLEAKRVDIERQLKEMAEGPG